MSYEVRLSAGAQRDFYQAQEYYDIHAPEQTDRFVGEFFDVAYRLADYPYLAPVIRGAVRRVGLRVFPYQLWYRVQEKAEFIEIIAVLHIRQESSRVGG